MMKKIAFLITLFFSVYASAQNDLKEKIRHNEDLLYQKEQWHDSISQVIENLKLEWVRAQIKQNGLPEYCGNCEIAEHLAMTLCYDEKHEQAKWVVHIVTPDIIQGKVGRSNDFREDTLISTGTACKDDYWYSGYDRGHLAPSADFRWSEKALSQSYFYSNISPQKPELNRKRWADLEGFIRQYVEENNRQVYVVTGGVLNDGLPILQTKTAKNKVSIPEYYYKVVADLDGDEIKGIGFIMPNGECEYPVISYAVTIDSIEALTGINFFHALPEKDQKTIESSFDIEKWLSAREKGDKKPLTGNQLPKRSINTIQAKSMIDKDLTVCGTVVSVRYVEKSGATFINLDRQFPNQIFTITIWKNDRTNFSYDLETLKGKKICVNGTIIDSRGTPGINAKNEKQITFLE